MRKVIYVKFHSVSYCPGIGELPDILPSQRKQIPGLEIWDAGGPELVLKAQDKFGRPIEAALPKTGAQIYLYETEVPATPKKAD